MGEEKSCSRKYADRHDNVALFCADLSVDFPLIFHKSRLIFSSLFLFFAFFLSWKVVRPSQIKFSNSRRPCLMSQCCASALPWLGSAKAWHIQFSNSVLYYNQKERATGRGRQRGREKASQILTSAKFIFPYSFHLLQLLSGMCVCVSFARKSISSQLKNFSKHCKSCTNFEQLFMHLCCDKSRHKKKKTFHNFNTLWPVIQSSTWCESYCGTAAKRRQLDERECTKKWNIWKKES